MKNGGRDHEGTDRGAEKWKERGRCTEEAGG